MNYAKLSFIVWYFEMASLDREIAATLTSLRSRGCHVNHEWLSECINYFRSENNAYSKKNLEDFVFEQWLLGDLRDVASNGSLPPNLENVLKTTISGKVACQVDLVTDIGHSSYSQMQKVRNEDVGNLKADEDGQEFQQAWEPKSNRMLQMKLSDGAQTIKAIEYRPIPSLKTDLVPGSKILIKGPVLCRRGIIMLEEKNYELLGGEVDALLIANAYENVLARKLNLPENPDPYKVTAVNPPAAPPPNNDLAARGSLQNAQPNLRPPPPPNPQLANRPPAQTNVNHSVKSPGESSASGSARPPVQPRVAAHNQNQGALSRKPVSTVEQPVKKLVQSSLQWPKPAAQPQILEFHGNDEDFLNIPLNDVDYEAEMEYQRNIEDLSLENENDFNRGESYSVSNSTNTGAKTSNKSIEFDFEEPKSLIQGVRPAIPSHATGRISDETNSVKRPASSALADEPLKKPLFSKRRKETSSSQEVSSTSDLDCLMIDDDIFNMVDIPSDVPVASTQSAAPSSVSPHPFVYISLCKNYKSKHSKIFKVKAAVITVIEKLRISNDEWTLTAKITDGSDNIDVRFSGKVLEELIGLSPLAMKEMRKQPSNSEILRQKLKKAEERMINLNCLLDLEKVGNQDHLVVVSIEEISPSTVSALKSRLSNVL